MGAQYIAFNAAVPTTAAMTAVSTGTAIKTLLQLTIVAWGITYTGAPSAIATELINTTTVAGGTPTAVTPSVLTPGAPVSVATAGFSPGSEGTVVATCRVFDHQILSTNNYSYEFSLGREPILDVSQVLRVRVTAAVAVNAICWIRWEE